MDLTPSGQVYELNQSGQLNQLTPSTGVTTPVGSIGTLANPGSTTTGALTNGPYDGIDAQTGNLYSINTTSGATTQVGGINPAGVALVPLGSNFETGVSASGSVLYYTLGISIPAINPAPGLPPCTVSQNDTLYQINPADGTSLASPVQVSGNGFVGSAFVGGTLYGFTRSPA